MQLHGIHAGAWTPSRWCAPSRRSRLEAVLYQDVNDPRGIGVLTLAEDPAVFVHGLRELLNAEPFAGLVPSAGVHDARPHLRVRASRATSRTGCSSGRDGPC